MFWIPTFVGMTEGNVEMKKRVTGMTLGGVGMTERSSGMTEGGNKFALKCFK